jgi:site-specific recombinase XerD
MRHRDDANTLPALRLTSRLAVPALFAHAGEGATEKLLEFLTGSIRNPNTRASYTRAIFRFAEWCDKHGSRLESLQPVHAAAYVEELTTRPRAKEAQCSQQAGKPLSEKAKQPLSKPTVKQHLAALRVLGNFLVTGQIIATNPFGPVKGPKHVVKKGKTPVLTSPEMRQLLDSLNVAVDEHGNRMEKVASQLTVAELRDRALISLMAFSFARISAALGMNVSDYMQQGKRC